jgi:N-acyl homoserine lactone hydrolase
MKEYTIHPLVVGVSELDKGTLTYRMYYGRRIWIPIYVFYIEGADKNIIVDTGLSDFVVPEKIRESFGVEILTFEEALAKFNLTPKNIDIIIHTHLHNDHCENDRKCTNAKIIVQEEELRFLYSPHPIDSQRYDKELLAGLRVVPLKGDKEIVEGIEVLFTPGHTPGTQSVAINTSKGKAIITGFCCDWDNFPSEAIIPVVTPGVHINAIEAFESALRVRGEADILLPLHDIAVAKMGKIP